MLLPVEKVKSSFLTFFVFVKTNLLFDFTLERVFWLWDLATGTPVRSLRNFPKPFGPAIFNPHDENLIFCATSFTIQVWDIRTNEVGSHMNSSGLGGPGGFTLPAYIPKSESEISPISISPCGNFLLTSFGDSFRVWDVRTQRAINCYVDVNKDRVITDVAIHNTNYGRMFSGDSEGNIIANQTDAGFNSFRCVDTDLMPQLHGRIITMRSTEKDLYAISRAGVSIIVLQ